MFKKSRTLTAAVIVSLALVAAACTSPGGGGSGASLPDFRFTANKVTVVEHNDTFLYGQRDEPFVMNLWFRVKVNQPGSAQVGLIGDRANAYDDFGNGESVLWSAASRQRSTSTT